MEENAGKSKKIERKRINGNYRKIWYNSICAKGLEIKTKAVII